MSPSGVALVSLYGKHNSTLIIVNLLVGERSLLILIAKPLLLLLDKSLIKFDNS